MVFAASFFAAAALLAPVLAYDHSRDDNLVVYWGQNSYGASHTDEANWQKSLATYCEDDSIDVIPLAFLHVFQSAGGLPEINMANSCNANDNGVFEGTALANCQFLAEDIKTCQDKGKALILSLGGATGGAVLADDAAGEAFAQTVWDLFLGGSSDTRPFGDAVLDGVDLDIEGGGSTGLAAFGKKIKDLGSGLDKPIYLAAAPQCPFPDAYLGSVIDAVGFDAIYIQFYNNFCGNPSYPTSFNYGDWDNWAKTVSPNKDVKLYIGGLADTTAGSNGYVDAAQLVTIATETREKFPGNFGGVMLWDASQAYANGHFEQAVKSGIANGAATPQPDPTTTGGETTEEPTSEPTTTEPEPSDPTTTTNPPPPAGDCGGAEEWNSSTAYVGGTSVVHEGKLYTAKWWTQGETPGSSDVWTDAGACASKKQGHLDSLAVSPIREAEEPEVTERSVPRAWGSRM